MAASGAVKAPKRANWLHTPTAVFRTLSEGYVGSRVGVRVRVAGTSGVGLVFGVCVC